MPARLHHERIAAPGAVPAAWLVLVHGIFGAGSNWRSIARKLVERRPEWGIVLVDLRQHGRSERGQPPHDLAACAADLRASCDELADVAAIAGHSFGGKVALAARPLAAPSLRQTWMFDASPGARPGAMTDPDNTVVQVLALMERLPKRWARREDFVTAVVAAGHAAPFAQWLAMNVVPEAASGGFVLRLDLAAMREMLADHYARDLWPVALDPAGQGELHLVIAEQSAAVSAADRARLAPVPPHVHVHLVDAGHWLHIEAAASVVELLVRHLPTPLRSADRISPG